MADFPDPVKQALIQTGYDSSAWTSNADGNVFEVLNAVLAGAPPLPVMLNSYTVLAELAAPAGVSS